MAIVNTTSTVLKIDNQFLDGDTRTITLKNPKAAITRQELDQLDNFMFEKNVIVGDKAGASFGKIKAVTRITTDTAHIGFEV